MEGKNLKILSLDGGGIRGLSSLLILDKIMFQVGKQIGKQLGDPKFEIHPWQYFDLIGGTSTGGIIAIMLGRLRMSVQDCIREYNTLSERVFKKRQKSPHKEMFSADELEKAIQDVVDQYLNEDLSGSRRDAPLIETRPHGCKVMVFTLSKDAATGSTPQALRSYDSDIERQPEFKLWQAARATSAAPTFFPPLVFDGQEWIDAGFGFNNPCRHVLDEAAEVWGVRRKLNDKNIGVFLTVGTGVPDVKSLETTGWKKAFDHLQLPLGAVDAMKAIVTGTEREHIGIRNRFPQGVVHRFNVVGISVIELFEYEKLNRIQGLTQEWLRGEANDRIDDCVERMVKVHQARNRPSSTPGLQRLLEATERKEDDELDLNSIARGAQEANTSLVSSTPWIKTVRQAENPYMFSNVVDRRVSHFVNRPELLERIEQAFSQSTDTFRTVVVSGTAGEGKTQIVLRYCTDKLHLNETGYDSILWLEASSEKAFFESFNGLWNRIRKRDEVLTTLEERVQRMKEHIAKWQWRWLFVLDNYDDPEGFADFKDHIPRSSNGSLLVISRSSGLERLGAVVQVGQLGTSEALTLLLGPETPESSRTSAKEDLGKAIVERLGYLALAVDQARSFMQDNSISLEEFLGTYEEQEAYVMRTIPSGGWEYGRTLNGEWRALSAFTTWEISFQKLKDDELGTKESKEHLLLVLAFLQYRSICFEIFTYPSISRPRSYQPRLDILLPFMHENDRTWDTNKLRFVLAQLRKKSLLYSFRPGTVDDDDRKFLEFSLHPLNRAYIIQKAKKERPKDLRPAFECAVACILQCCNAYLQSSRANPFELTRATEIQILQHLNILLKASKDPAGPIKSTKTTFNWSQRDPTPDLEKTLDQMTQRQLDRRRQARQDICSWLSPYDIWFSGETATHGRMLFSKSGHYDLRSSNLDAHSGTFATWHKKPTGLLWCSGIIGAGKSVLLRRMYLLLDELYPRSILVTLNMVLARDIGHIEELFCSTLRQLFVALTAVSETSGLETKLQQLRKDHKICPAFTQPEVMEYFRLLHSQRSRLFILVDGLDQVRGHVRDEFLSLIEDLSTFCNVVITTRPVVRRPARAFQEIRVNPNATETRVWFMNAVAPDCQDQELLEALRMYFDSNAHFIQGSFQFVRIWATYISQFSSTSNNFIKALGDMQSRPSLDKDDPFPDLEIASPLYKETFARIREQLSPEPTIAYSIFAYLLQKTASAPIQGWRRDDESTEENLPKPLTFGEMQDALSEDVLRVTGEEVSHLPTQRILDACSGFVQYDNESKALKFCHWSIRKFLFHLQPDEEFQRRPIPVDLSRRMSMRSTWRTHEHRPSLGDEYSPARSPNFMDSPSSQTPALTLTMREELQVPPDELKKYYLQRTALRFLNNKTWDQGPEAARCPEKDIPRRLQMYPLLGYAANSWTAIREVVGKDEELTRLAVSALENNRKFEVMRQVLLYLNKNTYLMLAKDSGPLHLVARYGITALARPLIESGHDILFVDSTGRNPIETAKLARRTFHSSARWSFVIDIFEQEKQRNESGRSQPMPVPYRRPNPGSGLSRNQRPASISTSTLYLSPPQSSGRGRARPATSSSRGRGTQRSPRGTNREGSFDEWLSRSH